MKIILVILITVMGLWGKPIFTNNDQLDTSNYIESLKDLLVATQKTRGMTYTYLKGESSVVFKIMDFHKDMKDALLKLEISELGGDKALKNRELRLSETLIRLNKKAMKMNVDEMFTEYTIAIENILVLANLAQIQSAENLNAVGKLSVENLLTTALPLTEKIGQLRAYGSGGIVVMHSNKTVHPLEHHKINILLKEIEQHLRDFEIGATAVSAHYSSGMDIDLKTALSKNRDDIDNLEKLTKDIFVEQKPTKLTGVQYFALATKTIDNLLHIFELQNRAIKESSKGWF
ncbi:MAG: hypothetical protein WBF77_03180 [Sulfurimonadaceae bacterium]